MNDFARAASPKPVSRNSRRRNAPARARSSPRGPSSEFRPDLECYAAAAVSGGAGVLALGAGAWLGHAVIGAVLACGAWVFALQRYRDGKRRSRGFVVEAETLAALQTECDARGWVLKKDVWFDGVGNLDAVVETEEFVCILEIKSYGGLRVQAGSVVRCNREATPAAKELNQAQRQSSRLKGAMGGSSMPVLPVLWCPKAQREAGVVHDGVLLANGSVGLMCDIIAELGTAIGRDSGNR